jgi:LPXTG-motif cell wall-anchored protein
VEETPDMALNSAAPLDAVSWETLTEDDIEKNTVSEASKTEELPNTGPTHILLFILTFIIATLFFVFRFKRS